MAAALKRRRHKRFVDNLFDRKVWNWVHSAKKPLWGGGWTRRGEAEFTTSGGKRCPWIRVRLWKNGYWVSSKHVRWEEYFDETL